MAKKKTQLKHYVPTPDEYVAQKWIFQEGYKIRLKPTDYLCNEFTIEVQLGNKKWVGEEKFKNVEAHKEVWKLYKKIYDNKNK